MLTVFFDSFSMLAASGLDGSAAGFESCARATVQASKNVANETIHRLLIRISLGRIISGFCQPLAPARERHLIR
jgi:hypothetical protein